MRGRNAISLTVFGLVLTFASGAAFAQDAAICFDTAERLRIGEPVEDAEKRAAHEACLKALSDSSNVVQKYQLQEADFDIMGTRPKN